MYIHSPSKIYDSYDGKTALEAFGHRPSLTNPGGKGKTLGTRAYYYLGRVPLDAVVDPTM